KNHDLVREPTRGGWWMVLALALLVAVGFVVHTLTYQALFPEHWQGWYAPQGVVNADGHRLHQWHLPRFLFFILLSAPIVGAWLYGYRRYLQGAGDDDPVYVRWLARLGQQWIIR
ncbi:hypothetical protein RZS08_50135, partial [Arthrospira platensis SPKY1]|nr:hypothetical protein [Arthrospira platensis SPKY1]